MVTVEQEFNNIRVTPPLEHVMSYSSSYSGIFVLHVRPFTESNENLTRGVPFALALTLDLLWLC